MRNPFNKGFNKAQYPFSIFLSPVSGGEMYPTPMKLKGMALSAAPKGGQYLTQRI